MGKKGTRKKKGGSFFDGITFESITGVAKNFANDVMSGAKELTKKGKEITNNSSAASQPARPNPTERPDPTAQQGQPAITDPLTLLTNKNISVGGKRKHRRSRNKRKSRKSKSKKHRRRKTKKRRCNCPCKKC